MPECRERGLEEGRSLYAAYAMELGGDRGLGRKRGKSPRPKNYVPKMSLLHENDKNLTLEVQGLELLPPSLNF